MNQDKVNACYAIEDNKEALECVKECVRTDEGNCHSKLVLLTHDSCTPCEKEKDIHRKAINEGIIQLIDIDTPEGMEISKKNDIDFVPILVLLDCKNKIIYPSD